ncbi:MAG: hypothetical protein JWO37_25 [Acidimicrobiales bacterium]|nr:hypothetical protein [Acidimicrobiales bacterium]
MSLDREFALLELTTSTSHRLADLEVGGESHQRRRAGLDIAGRIEAIRISRAGGFKMPTARGCNHWQTGGHRFGDT